jgi:uncharacterized protein (TIGR02145 family)
MAQNLNVKTNDGDGCYGNKESNCTKYGRLYSWNAVGKVCPAGWHLPSKEEWDGLVNAVGGVKMAAKKLKAKSGWNNNNNGTDDYGFSALPGGGSMWVEGDGGDYGMGTIAEWWVGGQYESGLSLYIEKDALNERSYDMEMVGSNSVRCVAD